MTLSLACLTCAKAFEHAGGNAAGYAILLMLVLLTFVLGTLFVIMLRMARRSAAHADDQYADTFILPSSTQE